MSVKWSQLQLPPINLYNVPRVVDMNLDKARQKAACAAYVLERSELGLFRHDQLAKAEECLSAWVNGDYKRMMSAGFNHHEVVEDWGDECLLH